MHVQTLGNPMNADSSSESPGKWADLTAALAPFWPDLYSQLGARAEDFIEAASRKALRYLISDQAALARYVNLCCGLGPNFEDKPENEWALALLSDDRLDEWVKVHQLVCRSAVEVGRRPGSSRIKAAQIAIADKTLLDQFDAKKQVLDREAPGLARVACDLEAVDFRLLEIDWRSEYCHVQGKWQLSPAPVAKPSVRMGLGQPAPELICVLTHAPKTGPAARLQVRLLSHSRCRQEHHPLVSYAGSHGLSQWRGHLAQAVSWYVYALPSPLASKTTHFALMAEPVPDAALLRTTSCGLRDEGLPIGALETYVWAYPADQWLLSMQRQGGEELKWPKASGAQPDLVPGTTRCRLERDGMPLPTQVWVAEFQEGLYQNLCRGLDQLFLAWQRNVQQASMSATVALLAGQSTLTWGWREGALGMAGRPLMRAVGDFDLNNKIQLELNGEVEVGVTRTKVRLHAQGDAAMKALFTRESETPTLLDVFLPAVSRWQFKFQLEFDPLAVEEAALWSGAGPCTGLVVGEAGLRPKANGGGWQWYVRMRVEPVNVTICVFDPVLGQTHRTLFLLPGVDLINWSTG